MRAAGMAAPLVLVMQLAFAAEFDIPLTELKEIQKKPVSRAPANKQKPPKKKVAKKATAHNAAASQTAISTAPSPARGAQQPLKPGSAIAPVVASEQAPEIIIHLPFSYLVSGKRTQLSAVINSSEPLQSVRCQFRSAVSSSGGQVSMNRAGDSKFTYSATLPALNSNAQSLQYRIIVTEQSGRVLRSPEYTIPLRSTTVVPGWQQEPDTTPVTIRVGTPGSRPVGFTDNFVEEQQ